MAIKPDKPAAVRIAIGLFCATIGLGAIKLVRALSMPAAAGSHALTIFAFIAIYGVMALLIVYIAMGASWARGGLLIISLIGILPAVPLVLAHFERIPVAGALTCAQAIAQVIGLYLVYREPTANWFRRPLSG